MKKRKSVEIMNKPTFKQPHYSGVLSKDFWAAVNKLPEPDRGVAYYGGVLLQELEIRVLRLLPGDLLGFGLLHSEGELTEKSSDVASGS